ncbi:MULTISPECIES: ABC transporter permease [unclassified Nostoc]|uniref:ABC transporter permease n=1 Tax=unclassified Nostoc TaxID=2593658 RepID=UPI002AD2BDBB|nr:ABC transporter permease [Nostoc sp. DedQUE03]MDZ7975145.1 ABC transporter permease [Nostoc sp. DedQUE03]MDZ8045673.1 ABC transporter permease [Nostoc sp. DedQUE02]
MKRIISQCRKELAQFQRDRLTLALAFILPLMALFIFGFGIRLEAKNIPLSIQDFDLSPLSRAYIETLFATNQFEKIPVNRLATSSVNNNQELIDKGIAKVVVVIPPDFSQKIKSGSISHVQVLVDATDVNNARVIKNSISATTVNFVNHYKGVSNKILAHVRIWFNPGRQESLYIIPGSYGVILWIFPSLLAAISMVQEKTQGTILQVYASNTSATELILGKGLAYFLIGIFEAILIMGLGVIIWQISFAAEPSSLLVGTLAFLMDSVMFGMLIGIRANNQIAAIQAVVMIGFLTSMLLSGFIYPLSNIPFPLSVISNILPARYYIEIARDAYARGTGWSGVWFAIAILIFLGLLIFNTARKKLKRMQLPD